MIKQLLPLIILLGIYSCSKDKNDPPPAPAVILSGSIEYKVNGTLFTIDNTKMLDSETVFFRKKLPQNVPTTRYILNANKHNTNYISFTILKDSLDLADYHYDSVDQRNNAPTFAFALIYNDTFSSLFFAGDYIDINISSYKNGQVSGTFAGKATPFTTGYSIKNSFVITEGKLKDVTVLY